MKKFISTSLAILVLIIAGVFTVDFIGNYSHQISDELVDIHALVQEIQDQEVSEQPTLAEREVRAPAPLKSFFNNPTAHLTVLGTINETNAQREVFGLPALKQNAFLNEAAQRKVEDMFAQQYFEHVSPQGVDAGDVINSAGYEYITVGENLALGNYDDDAELVQAWMDSPGHRENILHDRFTEIGVAVMKGEFDGHTTWLAVQEFGRPLSLCPAVNNSLSLQIDAGQKRLDDLGRTIEDKLQTLNNHKPENPSSQEEVDAYNILVKEYNELVAQYEIDGKNLKSLVDLYNSQVRAYNACLRN